MARTEELPVFLVVRPARERGRDISSFGIHAPYDQIDHSRAVLRYRVICHYP